MAGSSVALLISTTTTFTTLLASGATVTVGTVLHVKPDATVVTSRYQYVITSNLGVFTATGTNIGLSSGCSNRLYNGGTSGNGAVIPAVGHPLTLTTAGTYLIYVSYDDNQNSQIISGINFQLNVIPAAASTNAPTSLPTASPTLVPTSSPTSIPSLSPTSLPTFNPNYIAPTAAPSISQNPTSTPTLTPTSTPSISQSPTTPPTAIPTRRPTASPTAVITATPTFASPTDTPTFEPTFDKLTLQAAYYASQRRSIIGGLVGGMAIALVLATVVFPLLLGHSLVTLKSLGNMLYYIAILFLSALNMALVMAWATNGTDTDTTFLGVPGWGTNPFAYHPIFGVAVLFNGLMLRFMIGHTGDTKGGYVFLLDCIHIILFVGVCVSQYSVYSYRNWEGTYLPSLTTFHSWVGFTAYIAIVAVVIGHFTTRITVIYDMEWRENWRVIWAQTSPFISTLAFYLTTIAVCTGIQTQLSWGTCNPANTEIDYTNPLTPTDYKDTPESCKIGHGKLGIL